MPDFTSQLLSRLPQMRRFAYTLTGNTTDADDLVQICLEKALRKSSQFDGAQDVQHWLFKIMRNAFIDQTRAQARTPDFVDLDHPVSAAQPDPSAKPDDDLGHRDVITAISKLPEDQRMVVALVLVNGHSYEEAADILSVPKGTIMSRLSRARHRLGEALASHGVSV